MVRGTNIANSVQPGLCVQGAGRLRARRVEGWHVGATTSRSDNIPHACPLQRKASSLSEPAVMRQRQQATTEVPTTHHGSPAPSTGSTPSLPAPNRTPPSHDQQAPQAPVLTCHVHRQHPQLAGQPPADFGRRVVQHAHGCDAHGRLLQPRTPQNRCLSLVVKAPEQAEEGVQHVRGCVAHRGGKAERVCEQATIETQTAPPTHKRTQPLEARAVGWGGGQSEAAFARLQPPSTQLSIARRACTFVGTKSSLAYPSGPLNLRNASCRKTVNMQSEDGTGRQPRMHSGATD